jgi:hypothetical protein
MNISFLNIFFWRYCLRKLDEYPFFRCDNNDSVREMTRDALKDLKLALWLDKLLNRQEGYHFTLLKKQHNSKVIRQIDYLSKILISTVIKNDIGIRGAIAPVFNNFSPACNCPIEKIALPESIKFVELQRNNYDAYSLISLRNAPDDYIIPFTSDSNRIILSKKMADQINATSTDIIMNLFEENSISIKSDCTFFAIDYFIANEEIIPFEWHYPGRGIGLHFLPFLYGSANAEVYNTLLENIKSDMLGYYKQDINLMINNAGTTNFHKLDKAFISLVNGKTRSLLSKSIDLDVPDKKEHFHSRHIPIHGIKIRHLNVNKYLSLDDIPKIKDSLGNWIIVKTEINLPWWSSIRQKPEIYLVDERMLRRVNYLLTKFDSIILQELITESTDIYNYFGELRAYYILME